MSSLDLHRPIDDTERPHLKRLGEILTDLRADAGLTQQTVAQRAHVTASLLCLLEHGRRRTRESTLRRIVVDGLEKPDALDTCIQAAGPSLAPESEYAERVTRRRERRWQKRP